MGSTFKDLFLPLGGTYSVRVRQFGADDARPHVVVLAGVHGDEWHSVVALLEACQELEPVELSGRLTIVPAANGAALGERSRESCLVAGDLNRSFASQPRSGPTPLEEYADQLWSRHLAGADVLVDFHSGGVHDVVPHARIQAGSEEVLPLVAAMQYRYAMVWDPFPEGMLVRVALAEGCRAFAVEEGSGYSLEPSCVQSIRTRLRRLLIACGLLPGDLEDQEEPAIVQQGVCLTASDNGVFWPAHPIGGEVDQGSAVGSFRPYAGEAVTVLRSPTSGLIFSQLLSGPAIRNERLVAVVAKS